MAVPSHDLIRRTRETEVAYTISRMRILERLTGNPVEIACREIILFIRSIWTPLPETSKETSL